MSELCSVTLAVQPQREAQVPAWLGRAAQANFLHTLETLHPVLSKLIHDAPGAKPFTSSTLMGGRKQDDQLYVRRDATLHLRYATLHPQLTTLFQQGMIPMWKEAGLDLHGLLLRVLAERSENDEADYVQLVDEASDKPFISFSFTSPTSFKRTGGYFTPLPQPELVFSSLLDRWNAFAPFRLPETLYDTMHAEIVIDHTNIQTEILTFAKGQKGIIPGFTGRVTYRLLCRPAERRYLHALAQFAQYSGVGVKTTVGMGQVYTV